MSHLPLVHHETSKHDSPDETKIKEKQNETIPDSNSNFTKSMTHHNQTNELTTWSLICCEAGLQSHFRPDALDFILNPFSISITISIWFKLPKFISI
jgi:hypothetical protein